MRPPILRPACSLLVLLSLAAGCTRGHPAPAAGARSDGGIETSESGDVKPVYPLTGTRPHPLAERLCGALHDLPEARRASCCGAQPGFTLSSECVRMLSAALADRALTIDAAAVDACLAARRAALAGCDWVGFLSPTVPEACQGIVRGNLAAQARCRSSLECRDGMRCHGAGPTSGGVCGPAHADLGLCSLAVDALAAILLVDDLDRSHPECQGYCNRHRCVALVPLGGECPSRPACGPSRHCAGGRCVEGVFALPGGPCTAGGCQRGLLCRGDRCLAPLAEGERCASNLDCRGLCNKAPGQSHGVCRPGCAGGR